MKMFDDFSFDDDCDYDYVALKIAVPTRSQEAYDYEYDFVSLVSTKPSWTSCSATFSLPWPLLRGPFLHHYMHLFKNCPEALNVLGHS